MSTKRKSTVQPIEVQSILTGSSAMAAKASPVEHVASPTSPTHSISSSLRGHGRAMSIAESTSSSATVRTNRFSTSFPVQPAGTGASSPTRTIARSPTREGPCVVPETLASPTGPTDTNFLTAIAASERRVLELKEELQRAEADLNQLKKQWIQHEANKKRNDARRVTKLQPLQTSLPSVDKEEDADESSAWMQQEVERRKVLMNGSRSSNRTVFSGSRHTRTLSLLSPATETRPPTKQPRPPRKDSLSSAPKHSTDSERSHTRPSLMARTSTTPDLTTEMASTADMSIDLPDNLDKAQLDPLIQQGKKMASDFSSGLWTFFEDLRQATAGDEATQHEPVLPFTSPNMRRQGSVQSMTSRNTFRPTQKDRSVKTPSPARRQGHIKSAAQGALPDLADPSFFSEHGVATPAATVKKSPTMRGHVKAPSKGASVARHDAWDTWDDSPKDSRSSSAGTEASDATTLPSTASVSGSVPASPGLRNAPADREHKGLRADRKVDSERGEGDVAQKKDPIPWPALSKFGPATLRRTASHLVNEWEKSLTPSPGKEYTGQEDYLGLGSEVAATGVGGRAG